MSVCLSLKYAGRCEIKFYETENRVGKSRRTANVSESGTRSIGERSLSAIGLRWQSGQVRLVVGAGEPPSNCLCRLIATTFAIPTTIDPMSGHAELEIRLLLTTKTRRDARASSARIEIGLVREQRGLFLTRRKQ